MKIIGMRTVKTAIAVFLCLLIFVILKLVELAPGVDEGFAFNWYNPFFGGLATCYSLQSTRQKSVEQAKNRCIASLIGGTLAILLIFFYGLCGGVWPSLSNISLTNYNTYLAYLLTSCFTILVIVVGNLVKQPQAIFVALLTFLSVTINPNTSVANWEFRFGINRILSTIVGVLIALCVNSMFNIHWRKRQNLVSCIGLEGILKNDNDEFRGYIRYTLNSFKEEKLPYTFFTTRTPSTFMNIIEDFKPTLPIICMSGACLYDAYNNRYLKVINFTALESQFLLDLFHKEKITPFINVIKDDTHFIYNEEISNEAEKIYVDLKKNESYVNFVPHRYDSTADICYFLLLEKEEKIDDLVKIIMCDKTFDFTIQVYEFLGDVKIKEKLKYLKIYPKKIDDFILKDYLKENNLTLQALISSPNASLVARNASEVVILPTSGMELRLQGSIEAQSYEAGIKRLHKNYYRKE